MHQRQIGLALLALFDGFKKPLADIGAGAERLARSCKDQNPDVVVLGGGLVEEMPELFLGEVEKTARGRVMPAFKDRFKVLVAALGDDATITGAAAWAREVVKAGGAG